MCPQCKDAWRDKSQSHSMLPPNRRLSLLFQRHHRILQSVLDANEPQYSGGHCGVPMWNASLLMAPLWCVLNDAFSLMPPHWCVLKDASLLTPPHWCVLNAKMPVHWCLLLIDASPLSISPLYQCLLLANTLLIIASSSSMPPSHRCLLLIHASFLSMPAPHQCLFIIIACSSSMSHPHWCLLLKGVSFSYMPCLNQCHLLIHFKITSFRNCKKADSSLSCLCLQIYRRLMMGKFDAFF